MTLPYILPTIGSSGVFEFASPFDKRGGTNEKYTVKAIRTISEIEANSVDVKTLYYLDNGLTEINYIEHLEKDMHIVSLQSGFGQYIEVPAVYILKYPRIDGVPYQRNNIVVLLPAVPLSKDLTILEQELKGCAEDFLGVECGTAVVETSTIVYLEEQEHRLVESERALKSTAALPQATIIRQLREANQSLRDRIAQLEGYLINNGTVQNTP